MPANRIPRTKGNVFIKYPNNTGIYLYTQHKGHQLPKILQDALKRGASKWGDTATLSRVIFGEMLQNEILNLDGCGITTELVDNENLILVVDDQKELVGIFGEYGRLFNKYTFQQYLALKTDKLTWPLISGGYSYSHDYREDSPDVPANTYNFLD